MMSKKQHIVTFVSFIVLVVLFVGFLWLWKQWAVKPLAPAPVPTASVVAKKTEQVVAQTAPPVDKKPVAKKAKKAAKKKPPAPTNKPAPAPAVAEAREWKRWNAAPYATSREETCKKAPEAIDGFAFPMPVKEQFKKLLGTDCKGAVEAWLTPGTPLEQMWSGGKPPHVMDKMKVAELPVLQSPDGRAYRQGAVAETAKALAWRVEHDGRAYMLYLPFVCFNWSWKFGVLPISMPPPPPPPPAPPAPDCATFEFVVAPGDEVRFAVLSQRRLPASSCWQLCDGNDCSAPPSPCDNCDFAGPLSVLPDGLYPNHSGVYVASAAKQSLRFPREARANFIALCVTREWFGQSNSWIVQPSAWNALGKNARIRVPYGGQIWPVWGEETIWPGWEYRPGY